MTDKVLKCLGLVLQYSPLSVAPGALARANDCVNRRENIIEDRRGYKTYATLGSNITQLLTYQNRVLVHRGTNIAYDNGSGTFSDYSGTYSAPTGKRIRAVEAFSNFYFTTDAGVKVFSDVAGTQARSAGAPRSLDPSYALSGVTGFLATVAQCAYRCTIQRTDANKVVVTGYPSQRMWVYNSAGASRNVDVTVYLPTEAKIGDVVQFFRTTQVTGSTDDISGDEMGLVYQYELVAADIAAGLITFTDSVTDTLRGATLYTSPSQEGIMQANDRPPLCKDMCLYKSNYVFFANTQTKQRLNVSMVGAGSLSGKTITLGGVTYNFGATEIISGAGSPQAKVSATGVVAVDIDLTARSLVKVINRYAGNTTVYAYYLSGPGDLPGQIMIEEKGIGAAAFTLNAQDTAIASMFFPAPPVNPATATKSTSSNQVQKNAIFFSKSQQPEHVPPLNSLLVGPSNKEILRVINLKESAIVIKEEGVYRITGETPANFTVTPLDLTVFCKADSSAVVISNQVMMLSNQGIVSISESGVQVISREIEPALTPLLSSANLSSYTSAFTYESERFYFISTMTVSTDTSATQTFVYNIFTKTWVRHTYAFAVGIVEQNADKMYFAKPSSAVLYVERKDFADSDYCDPESAITILATDAVKKTVDFSLSGVTPTVGWVIKQNASELSLLSISPIAGGYRATLSSDVPSDWTTGAASIFPSVGMDIEWAAWVGGTPEQMKQVHGAAILADDTLADNSATDLSMTFRSNFDPEREEVAMSQSRSAWGSAWGSTPWGGSSDTVGYPTYLPMNKQYSTRLTVGVKHTYARQKLVIAGYALSFRHVSERIGR